ncbi:hypothetical protein RHT52_004627 [Salmonella enterica]|nr:hypothetical protein [Salmonella enterica]
MKTKEIRKNKGDCTFYLTKDGDVYRLIKKRKAYAKPILKNGGKTTKITLCDISFSLNSFSHIDFNSEPLRISDKDIVVSMINTYDGGIDDDK